MTGPAKQLDQLGREAILAIPDIKREVVQIPEWGGAVTVQGLTGDERDDFEATCVKGRGKKTEVNLRNFRAKLVARSCIQEDGSRLFSDDDAAALGKKSGAAINRVFEVASRLSGLTDEDLEELAKN